MRWIYFSSIIIGLFKYMNKFCCEIYRTIEPERRRKLVGAELYVECDYSLSIDGFSFTIFCVGNTSCFTEIRPDLHEKLNWITWDFKYGWFATEYITLSLFYKSGNNFVRTDGDKDKGITIKRWENFQLFCDQMDVVKFSNFTYNNEIPHFGSLSNCCANCTATR